MTSNRTSRLLSLLLPLGFLASLVTRQLLSGQTTSSDWLSLLVYILAALTACALLSGLVLIPPIARYRKLRTLFPGDVVETALGNDNMVIALWKVAPVTKSTLESIKSLGYFFTLVGSKDGISFWKGVGEGLSNKADIPWSEISRVGLAAPRPGRSAFAMIEFQLAGLEPGKQFTISFAMGNPSNLLGKATRAQVVDVVERLNVTRVAGKI
jgi:hypothetical protein